MYQYARMRAANVHESEKRFQVKASRSLHHFVCLRAQVMASTADNAVLKASEKLLEWTKHASQQSLLRPYQARVIEGKICGQIDVLRCWFIHKRILFSVQALSVRSTTRCWP